jgi:hypothetical protein
MKVGDALMQAVIGEAEARGLQQQMLSAQVQATAFYERLGFSLVSEEFRSRDSACRHGSAFGLIQLDWRPVVRDLSPHHGPTAQPRGNPSHKTPRHVRMPGRFAVYDSTCPTGPTNWHYQAFDCGDNGHVPTHPAHHPVADCSFSVMAATEIVP